MSALVGLYNTIHSKDTSAYEAACAALTAKAMNGQPTWTKSAVAQRLRGIAHTSIETARAMAETGLAVLVRTGVVERKGENVTVSNLPATTAVDVGSVLQAVKTRLATYTSMDVDEKLVERIRIALSHVMLAQGMTVARTFANQESPEAYSLPAIVAEAVAAASVPHSFRDELIKSLVGVIGEPTPEISRVLFRLANSAYALESVFLNPLEANLGSLLQWKVYLDSNVVMRTLSPAARESPGFRDLFERLSKLNTPLLLLYPLAVEIVEHGRREAAVLQSLKISNLEGLTAYIGDLTAGERSPILLWYFAEVQRGGWRDMSRWLGDVGLSQVNALGRRLARFHIKIEGEDITRRFDTSARETLWDALREWRGGGHTSNARRLRRNEATQVEYLLRLREKGVRTWFLSIDGQLRHALKLIEGGKYAGFVITPTAWAHRLSDLHWGEVDIAGFTELMWTIPERSPRERLAQIAMRQVIERTLEKSLIRPDWLRDRVEAAFSDAAIDAFVQGNAPEQAAIFEDLVAQLVPPAVDAILDEIAKERST